MYENYVNVEYIIIYDIDFVNFFWSDDGSFCIIMIFLIWFICGWIVLELFMLKRVLVLLKI